MFVENEDVTEWLTSANLTDFKDYEGVSLTKTNTTQVEVTYTSGMTSVLQHRLVVECRFCYCD